MLKALPSSAMRMAVDFNAPRDVGVGDSASDESSVGELSVEFVSGVVPEPDSSTTIPTSAKSIQWDWPTPPLDR